MAAQATTDELRAELNPYDPPSNPKAFVAAGIIAALVIVAIVLAVLYGWDVFKNIEGTLGIQGTMGPLIEPLLKPMG